MKRSSRRLSSPATGRGGGNPVRRGRMEAVSVFHGGAMDAPDAAEGEGLSLSRRGAGDRRDHEQPSAGSAVVDVEGRLSG